MRWAVVPAIVLGMLVIVPVGLGLLEAPGLRVLRACWPPVAIVGALSLALPVSIFAVGLACVYALGTFVLAGTAAARFVRDRSFAPVDVAALTALVTPAVAGASLVVERAGGTLLGFGPKILLLTVAHFHYAGFAAALVAGLVASAASSEPAAWGAAAARGVAVVGRRAADFAALTVPAGTLLVLIGFFAGELVELAGAAVLTAGMWVVGTLSWRARASVRDRTARILLGVSSVVLVLTMLLALDWALGEAFGVPKLSLTWMAATHGVLNAVGFGLCAVLAWSRLSDEYAGRTPRAAS
ncbi:YndJ family protein [Cryptosporangium sp. NPDC048952]|uniref:YndJ family protein n=1 Tax=Cryptosporangium sp. NPDC048952 TaxID=3363961 RepID=UPI0037182466